MVTNAHPASASAPPRSPRRRRPRRPRPSPTRSCWRRCRRRPRCSRPTAPTATSRPTSTRSAREPRGDPAIQPENLNLTPELMSQIPASILRIGVPGETLLEALPRMRDAYCGTIALPVRAPLLPPAADVAAGDDRDRRQPPAALAEEKQRLLERLLDVFEFERFIEKAYLGQKMFSIEGIDVVVPMLDEVVTLALRGGAEEVVFGMAHRGRLSVLAHNLGRPLEGIFAEFEGSKAIECGEGGGGDPARRDRRRQVPLRPRRRLRDPRRREDRRPPLPEPEPPRVRRPGRPRRHPLRAGRDRGRRS